METMLKLFCDNQIVRVQYFVRGGFVGHRSRASSKHLSSHLPVDGARFLGGQTGVALQLQDARVGVGSTKKPTAVDVSEKILQESALLCITMTLCVVYVIGKALFRIPRHSIEGPKLFRQKVRVIILQISMEIEKT
ncbi:UNVERIFIED_CONTAM: hypothetical protein NCL1_34474 [Trichonephila clavipes]